MRGRLAPFVVREPVPSITFKFIFKRGRSFLHELLILGFLFILYLSVTVSRSQPVKKVVVSECQGASLIEQSFTQESVMGRPRLTKRKKTAAFSLSEEVELFIRQHAHAKNLSFSGVVDMIVSNYIDQLSTVQLEHEASLFRQHEEMKSKDDKQIMEYLLQKRLV